MVQTGSPVAAPVDFQQLIQRTVFRFPQGGKWCCTVCAPLRVPQKKKTLSSSQCIPQQSMAGVCGLVFLLLAVGLPLGNRFHKISGVGVAAQGQQSWHNGEEHIEGDNRPPLICWDSVCEGSAWMQRCSYMAPLGLEKRNSRIESTLCCFLFPQKYQ